MVLHELKINTSFGDKLCNLNSMTNCETVLNSKASTFFGNIKWSDIGIVYYSGTILYILGSYGSYSLNLIASLSVFAMPYPFFSIYYQAFTLKKWCPFCLFIQLLIIVEFIVLLPLLNHIILNINELLYLTIVCLTIVLIWILFKSAFVRKIELDKTRYSYQKLKRDPKLFLSLLKSNMYIEYVDDENLVIGNAKAPITITAFLSLSCDPCAEAFFKLQSLIKLCPEIKVNIIFSVHNNEKYKNMINYLYCKYNLNGSECILELIDIWYKTPRKSRDTVYKEYVPEMYNEVEKIKEKNGKTFERYLVHSTPTIYLNGFRFPNQYTYSDIEYFIDDLKELIK